MRAAAARVAEVDPWFFWPLQPGAYRLIVVDPPWATQLWSPKGYKKAPEAHYRTMSAQDIGALPIRRLLCPGGVAFIFATWPMVANGTAVNIIRHAWGLDLRTGGVWLKSTAKGKLRMGPGFMIRSCCEPFFLAVNGDRHTSHGFRGRGLRNVIETFSERPVSGLAREHSRKPVEIYDKLRAVTPGWKRADVFSTRRADSDWDVWGDQLGKFDGR